jgi:hypothetical protein
MVYVGDPRSPQTFNPINPVRVETGDVMTVTCTYDTTNEHDYVRYGKSNKGYLTHAEQWPDVVILS